MTIEELRTVFTTLTLFIIHKLKGLILGEQSTSNVKTNEQLKFNHKSYKKHIKIGDQNTSNAGSNVKTNEQLKLNHKCYHVKHIKNGILAVTLMVLFIFILIFYRNYSLLALIVAVWIFLWIFGREHCCMCEFG